MKALNDIRLALEEDAKNVKRIKDLARIINNPPPAVVGSFDIHELRTLYYEYQQLGGVLLLVRTTLSNFHSVLVEVEGMDDSVTEVVDTVSQLFARPTGTEQVEAIAVAVQRLVEERKRRIDTIRNKFWGQIKRGATSIGSANQQSTSS